MTDLIYKDEVYKIVGAAMQVHQHLGPGFLEAVYQEALAYEFALNDISYIEQVHLPVYYKDKKLNVYYIPDYVCFDEIIVEIKAIRKCTEIEEAQVLNALKASRKKVGILINFGEQSLYWKRYIY